MPITDDALHAIDPHLPRVALDPRESALSSELRAIDPHLEGFFLSGKRFAADLDAPGNLFFLAHAGRELLLGVTRHLASMSPGLPDDLDEILAAEASSESGDGSATLKPGSGTGEEEPDARREKHRRTLGEALQLDPTHPLVTRWFRVYKAIMAGAHYSKAPPSPAAVHEAFQQLTNLLYALIGPYFETRPVLDALLAKEKPTDADIDRLRDAMPRPAQRAYFFARLSHPMWLEPLAGRRLLDPPVTVRQFRDSGTRGWLPWPEGDYLVGMAAIDPAGVQRVLARVLPGNTSPVVWHTVGKAVQAMPPEVAGKMVPLLIKGLRSASGRFAGFSMTPVVRNLAAAAHPKTIALLDALLQVDRQPGDRGLYRGWRFSCVSDYEAHELLERVAAPQMMLAGAKDLLGLATRRLRLFTRSAPKTGTPPESAAGVGPAADASGEGATAPTEEEASGQDGPAEYDASSIWCDDVELELQEDDDLRQWFVSIATRAAVAISRQDPEKARGLVAQLQREKSPIFKRIALVVLREAGDDLPDQVQGVLGDRHYWDDYRGAGPEYRRLVRERFLSAAPEAQQVIITAVIEGPDPEVVRRNLGRLDGDASPEKVTEAIDAWRKHELQCLPTPLPTALQPLAVSFWGTAEPPPLSPEEMGFSRSRASFQAAGRPSSPIGREELAAMTDEQIISFLKTWTPGSGLDDPTPNGLGFGLTILVQANPTAHLGLLSSLQDEAIDPTYLRAVLQGCRAALSAGTDLPWSAVMETIEWITLLERPDDFSLPIDQSDPGYRWGKEAALEILQEGLARDLVPVSMAPRVLAILGAILRQHGTWIEPGTPPKTKALLGTSRIAELATECVIGLGLWAWRRAAETSSTGASPESRPISPDDATEPLLSDVLDQVGAAAEAAHAIIGRFVPYLMLINKDWTTGAIPQLWGRSKEPLMSDPGWRRYLTRNPMYDSVFLTLRSTYLRAIETLNEPRADTTSLAKQREDKDATNALARHILFAAVRGLVQVGDADQFLEKAYAAIPAEAWSDAYSSLLRDLMHPGTEPSEKFIGGVLTLWDWRLEQLRREGRGASDAEVNGLGWLAAIKSFPLELTLPRIESTVALAGGHFSMRDTIWGRLVAIRTSAPEQATAISSTLIEGGLAEDHVYFPQEEVEAVLSAGIRRGGATAELARRLVHRLGENQALDLSHLLRVEEAEASP